MTGPAPVSASLAMPDWLKALKDKMQEVERNPTGFMRICKTKNLPPNFFNFLTDKEAKKVRFHEGNIFLVAKESIVHQAAVQLLGADLMDSSYSQRRNLMPLTNPYFMVVNKFKCGQLAKKVPDVLLGTSPTIPTLAMEVAFRNENLDELYWESVHSLTEYTTIEIAIGMRIFSNEDDDRFEALLYAMRRVNNNTPAYPECEPRILLQRFRQDGIVENYRCFSNEGKFPEGDFRQQSRLGVEIFFEHTINEQNYHEDIIIPIEYPDDTIVIPGRHISSIRRVYKAWWRERNPAGANQ